MCERIGILAISPDYQVDDLRVRAQRLGGDIRAGGGHPVGEEPRREEVRRHAR